MGLVSVSRRQACFLAIFLSACFLVLLYADVFLERLMPIKRRRCEEEAACLDRMLRPDTFVTTPESASTEPKHEDKVPSFLRRVPSALALSRLTAPQLAIEKVTDPLDWSATCTRPVYLVILVVSKPSNVEARKAIRNAWADTYLDDVVYLKRQTAFQKDVHVSARDVVKTVFVLGRSSDEAENQIIRSESSTYNDVIIGDLLESYSNLTLKTRLALKWSYYNCRSTYILKTDDDVFVNPVALVEWLKSQPTERFYTGWCNFGSPVVRDKSSKWYVAESVYSRSTYPGYCLGGGYLMSEDVLGRVVELSYGRPIFPMEDLYVGLMVNDLRDVPIRDERKHFDLLYVGGREGCAMNDLFLAHQVFPLHQADHIRRARTAQRDC